MRRHAFRCSLIGLALLFGAVAHAQTVTHAVYVDAAHGDDARDGRTPETAWQTLEKVNAQAFGPGAEIRFRRGGTWTGRLMPKGSGAEGTPIRIGPYGDGARPALHGAGAPSTVFFENQQFWEIEGLEITNFEAGVAEGQEPANKRAVHVLAHDAGRVRHFVLRDLVVHDVNSGLNDRVGNPSRYFGGIFFQITGTDVPTFFDGVLVERCHVYDVDRTGISTDSSWWVRGLDSRPGDTLSEGNVHNWTPSLNIVVRDNVLERIGGNGIILRVVRNARVERNRAFFNGLKISGNAMFTFSSDSTLFQHNEAAFTVWKPGETDAGGIDSDFRTKYTIAQYNYLHDNGQGGLVATGGAGGPTPIPRFNDGTVFRYNVLENNARRGIHTSGVLTNMLVHNNVFFSTGDSVHVVHNGPWSNAYSDGDRYVNNLFVSLGVAPSFELSLSTNVTFERNLYFGTPPVHAPDDAAAIREDPRFVGGEGAAAYAVQPDSPVIDAGKWLDGFPTADFFGQPIPPGGPVSLGVHEASASSAEAAPDWSMTSPLRIERGAGGLVRVQLDGPSGAPAHLSVYDRAARRVAEQHTQTSAAGAVFDLDTGDLAPGIYVVRVAIGEALPALRRLVVSR